MTTAAVLEEKKMFYAHSIPQKLIYEELNRRKLYRRGYQNVLNQTKSRLGCIRLVKRFFIAQRSLD